VKISKKVLGGGYFFDSHCKSDSSSFWFVITVIGSSMHTGLQVCTYSGYALCYPG